MPHLRHVPEVRRETDEAGRTVLSVAVGGKNCLTDRDSWRLEERSAPDEETLTALGAL